MRERSHRLRTALLTLLGTLLIAGSISTTYAETTLGEGEYVIFYHHDLLGSPTLVTDQHGNTLWHEHSDPYGRARDRVSETGEEFLHDRTGTRKGYTGHLQDEGTDLVYMKARYYDPQIGRFYSNDPVGFTASNPMMFNRYAYANNNPYRYVDPNGSEPEDENQESDPASKEDQYAELGLIDPSAGTANVADAAARAASVMEDVVETAYWSAVGGFLGRAISWTKGFLGGIISSSKASQKDIDKATHLFGKNIEKHKLEKLLEKFNGDKLKALKSTNQPVQKLAKQGKIDGHFQESVNVKGIDVVVRGKVIDGVANIGTAFIP